MALTDTQKATVIFYLGYAGKTLIQGSTSYSKIISDRLENLSPEIETQTSSILIKIKDIDSRLEDSAGHFAAKKVGDIELNGNERMLLIAERSRYIGQLSGLLDIPSMGSGSGSGSGGICFYVRV